MTGINTGGETPSRRAGSTEAIRNVFHVQFREAAACHFIEILIVAVPLPHHLEFIQVPAAHRGGIILQRFYDCMLLGPCRGHTLPSTRQRASFTYGHTTYLKP